MDPRPLKIDGRDYPVPELHSFDMDEWEILYDKTGLTLETVDEAPLSPGLLRTLLIVAYRRGNPDAKAKQIEKIVGAINFLDAMLALAASGEEDEADPPAQAASSPPPSETSNPDTNAPSSGSVSATLAVVPPPTGTPLSVTPHTSSLEASGS